MDEANIAEFRRVLRRFGFSYDWRREIATCEPEYYRWNQWFFLRMFEKGWRIRKKSQVNWCPKCERCWRTSRWWTAVAGGMKTTLVESREIEQWFLRITQYADQLLDDMKQLEGGWPERVLTMQRNWIGKSRGTRVKFDGGQMRGCGARSIYHARGHDLWRDGDCDFARSIRCWTKLLEGVPGQSAMSRS